MKRSMIHFDYGRQLKLTIASFVTVPDSVCAVKFNLMNTSLALLPGGKIFSSPLALNKRELFKDGTVNS